MVSGTLAQILQILILARILDKHDMGLVAIVTLLNSFLDIFIGLGLTNALIQRSRVSSFALASVHWLNFGFSVVIFAVVIALSPVIAAMLGAPDAGLLISIGASAFLFTSWGQASRAMLEKRLLFKPLGIADVVFAVASVGVAVALALAGFGAYSAAIAVVVAALGRTIVFVAAGRRYFTLRWRMRLSETKRFLSFGVFQSLDGILNYIGNTLSSISTGRFVSTAALGGYNLAFNVGVSIPGRINPIITRVLFPYFTLIQGDSRKLRQNYLRMITLCGLASVPLLVGVAFTAEDVMTIAFGSQWSGFGPVLTLLAVAGMLRALGNPMGSLLQATDNVKVGLYFNIARTAVNIPLVIALTATWGILGAAWSMVIIGLISYVIGYLCLTIVTRTPIGEYVRSTATPFLVSIPLAVVVGALGLALADAPQLVRFPVQILGALAALVFTLLVSKDETVRMFMDAIRAKLTRSSAPRIAVLLPVEERFDGTGGAVATWVKQAYSRVDGIPYRIYSPISSESYAEGLAVAPLHGYRVGDRLLRVLTRIVGKAVRKNPNGLLRAVSLSGRFWVWWCRPALASADVVHIHNRPGYAVQLRRGGYTGRILVHMHNDAVSGVNSYLAQHKGRITADDVIAAIDEWAFCSRFLLDTACAVFPIADVSSVLYNGSTVEARATAPRAVDGSISAVFAGRLIPEKGVLEAILATEIACESVPTTLAIYGGKATGQSAGTSPYVEQLRSEADRINARFGRDVISLPGFVSPPVLLEAMSKAHVFVYPCQWDEPFGMVLVDAMSVGTPAVASARGGIPEIITPGVDGALVASDADTAEVAEAIIRLCASDGYPAISAAASHTARTMFSWDAISAAMTAILNDTKGTRS
ncbi:MOP flippase family protein [Microbacteriaceae bacterium VKM Ac-2855]|nr:MOP flippase family protein [Microbacteriaceae bacterium VKM Ac-2855]